MKRSEAVTIQQLETMIYINYFLGGSINICWKMINFDYNLMFFLNRNSFLSPQILTLSDILPGDKKEIDFRWNGTDHEDIFTKEVFEVSGMN